MRATILLIDSFGAGALPDAVKYGDTGANTLLHICTYVKGCKWPHLTSMGLGNAAELLHYHPPGLEVQTKPLAHYGLMREISPGKDTTTGHWELAGIQIKEPFRYFSQAYPSFPDDFLQEFIKKSGIEGILGNKAASGTRIIQELGEEHQKTACPICYTSADSVFQIAAHTDTIPLKRLYETCEIARDILNPLNVGRVIARPFAGEPGNYYRTEDRKDFSLPLPGPSLFDLLKAGDVETVAVGKTGSIFNEQGIERSYHDKGNAACLVRTKEILEEETDKNQFVFVNLVDTDMIFGHRRDPEGYFQAVDRIDSYIGEYMDLLHEGDLLIVTADHGCDPSFKGTDHTREHVPLLIYQKGNSEGRSLGIRNSFADLSASLLDYFCIKEKLSGLSFAKGALRTSCQL